MFLVVGLGNPGKEYENTRHNVGFMFIDSLVSYYGFSPEKKKFHSYINEGFIGGKKLLLQKPSTYMNFSGGAVLSAAGFYKIPNDNIIVIHDDLDLPVGKLRVKIGGGAGGHNGLKDIDAKLGPNYKRLRMGVGRPRGGAEVSDYVLGNFSKSDRQIVGGLVDLSLKNFELLLSGEDNKFTTQIALDVQKQ